ncbi:MAG: hypothetical protein IPM89_00010 [Candidatus Competibacteraceae bacterium]|nr:MAG: hypothetical protein IPM89_00010 [Candidatus Competibacteraceae bacterium]
MSTIKFQHATSLHLALTFVGIGYIRQSGELPQEGSAHSLDPAIPFCFFLLLGAPLAFQVRTPFSRVISISCSPTLGRSAWMMN